MSNNIAAEKLIAIKTLMQSTNGDLIRRQMALRRHMIDHELVGRLYPTIVAGEIQRLNGRLWRLHI